MWLPMGADWISGAWTSFSTPARRRKEHTACEAKKPSFMWKRTALKGSAYSERREEERTLKICSTAVMLILSRISSISTGEMVFRSLSELMSTASKGAR